MADTELRAQHTKTEWRWELWLAGVLVADLTATPHGGDVLIHNQVYVWSRERYIQLRRAFAQIREVFRGQGYGLIVTCAEHGHDAKMQRYWELMGFEHFGQITINGATVPYAVMEV